MKQSHPRVNYEYLWYKKSIFLKSKYIKREMLETY